MLMTLGVASRRWSDFVQARPSAHIFHHPAWVSMLSDCYGFPASALVLADSREGISAGLPVLEIKRPLGTPRWVSLPFTDHCQPLSVGRDDEGQLLAQVAQAAESAGVARVEIHAPIDVAGHQGRVVGVLHTLELGADPEAVRRTFSKSQVQRNINRAEREQITCRRGESKTDLTDAFYDLHVRTRRTQGVPVQPCRFFHLLWERILEPGLGFLLLAYSGTTPIAGGVFLAWNGTVTYKYGASNPEYLKLRPNHLIFWTAIRWSCENGYHTFDFGRSDLTNRGLRSFKSGWGTIEEPLSYSGIGGTPFPLRSERVQRGMGSVIRRSPLWLTRALGETFYPYAA